MMCLDVIIQERLDNEIIQQQRGATTESLSNSTRPGLLCAALWRFLRQIKIQNKHKCVNHPPSVLKPPYPAFCLFVCFLNMLPGGVFIHGRNMGCFIKEQIILFFVLQSCSHSNPAPSPRWPLARTCGQSRRETSQSKMNTHTTHTLYRSCQRIVPPNTRTFHHGVNTKHCVAGIFVGNTYLLLTWHLVLIQLSAENVWKIAVIRLNGG